MPPERVRTASASSMFESEDAVEAFRSALGSIPEDVGIAEPPQFFPAHTVYMIEDRTNPLG